MQSDMSVLAQLGGLAYTYHAVTQQTTSYAVISLLRSSVIKLRTVHRKKVKLIKYLFGHPSYPYELIGSAYQEVIESENIHPTTHLMWHKPDS